MKPANHARSRMGAMTLGLTAAFSALALDGNAIADPGVAALLSPQQKQIVNEQMGLLDSRIIHLDGAFKPARPFSTTVEIGGAEMVLTLRPHSVRAEGYAVWSVGADGIKVPVEITPVNTFRGEILGEPGSSVAATGSILCTLREPPKSWTRFSAPERRSTRATSITRARPRSGRPRRAPP